MLLAFSFSFGEVSNFAEASYKNLPAQTNRKEKQNKKTLLLLGEVF